MQLVIVRVLIKTSAGVFKFNGTAFFLNENTLVTAKHVVEHAMKSGDEVYISEIPNGGKLRIFHENISLCSRDMAVLKTKKRFKIESIVVSDKLEEKCEVVIEGYHNEDGAKSSYVHHVSSYVNHEHSYELQGHITNGLSGSPVLHEGKVCGIAQAIHRKDNLTFIIPISELCIDVNVRAKRLAEIERYLENNNLNMATKRAMDFVDDFSTEKKRRSEVLMLRRDYVSLNGALEKEDVLQRQILEVVSKVENEPNKKDVIQKPSSFFANKKNFLKNTQNNNDVEDAVMVAHDIGLKYKSIHTNFMLQPMSFSLKYGEITVLVGENGNGKTTLLDIVAGKLAQTKGELLYPELTQYGEEDWYSIKTQISYIEQRLVEHNGRATDTLHYTLGLRGIKGKANEDEVNFIMHRLGLEKYAHSKWSELSAGFKMRFSLAKALLRKPKLLVLDEPLANLDINTQQLFLNDLSDIAKSLSNRMAVILSSQNLYEVEAIADNIIFLSAGNTLYNGSMKAFGEERKYNSFEFMLNISEEELLQILNIIAYKQLKKEGSSYILTTEMSVSYETLLKLFLEKNIELQYFRDISKSTRKLFGEVQ